VTVSRPDCRVKPGESFSLRFDLKAVAGVKRVDLIGSGAVLKTQAFDQPPLEVPVAFALSTEHRAWYSLTVEDARGHKAYTDPIWVDPVGAPFAATPKAAAGR